MKAIKSPGAMAALGASVTDQLGGKVDPENSFRILAAQSPPPRAANAARCLAVVIQNGSRSQQGYDRRPHHFHAYRAPARSHCRPRSRARLHWRQKEKPK